MTWAFLVDSVPMTKAVIAGKTSLGGSESACLGLARALRARGHHIHIFTTQLGEDAGGPDHAGVVWHGLDEFESMNQFIEWDVVCGLRMFNAFAWRPVYARLRLLWNEDLLVPGAMQSSVMSVAWALDHLCYVSDYHRRQWEQLQPELAPLGWVTRNGFDPRDLPTSWTKDPHRIIHISRPERGLMPLLQMWPALKAKVPDATLHICRYSSMYDDVGRGSWGDVCRSYDALVQQVNAEVGGITYLGELTKPQLYQAISDAAVMWYPGVSSFAETSCIAALEAQACGTPFVGSYRGALPETVPGGYLIRGDETSPVYQIDSVQAVCDVLDGCTRQTVGYRRLQKDGRAHAQRSTYDVLAEQWEAQVETWFRQRYQAHTVGVLRQLLHEDDHVAAKVVAHDILDRAIDIAGKGVVPAEQQDRRDAYCEELGDRVYEARQAADFCDYVIAGKDQTSDHYAAAAIQDPLKEAEFSGRFRAVIPAFEGRTRVLDVACGNGSFAIALTLANPSIHVHGLDYAAHNIEIATEAATRAGVTDRCTFERCTVYDFDAQTLHVEWDAFVDRAFAGPAFDGLFVGEFVEHVGDCTALIDRLEEPLLDGAQVVYTCPHGACAELVPRNIPLRRGHVHRFHHDDLKAVWGGKRDFKADYLASGVTERGNPLGNWLIAYEYAPNRPAGFRPILTRILRTRPLQKLSVGLIVKDAENDLGRCLASIYKLADEIVIGDTGSTDTTKAIALSYGATVLDLAPIMEQPEGFAGARNAVLRACTGDWFHWIDADEQLLGGPWLRRYLDGIVFNGFVIHQTHLYMDGPPTFDIPVRVFRNTGKVQFYGCVHEQPQDGDPNADIYPTLEVADITLAHTGYLTPEGREEKRVERNLPLLVRDQQVFADRVLGQVLLIREAVLQADAIRARHGGTVVPKAQQGYAHALRMFLAHFDDPEHKYHKLARPWYEVALKHLGLGWEQEIALAGKRGGLNGQHAKPERLWVRDGEEYQRLVAFKAATIAKAMVNQQPTFITDPDALRPTRELTTV